MELVPGPLSIFWNIFAAARPTPEGTFAPGDYTCRFSVNHAVVVEKPLRTVSG